MDARQENWSHFRKRHPEVEATYQAFARAVHEEGGPLSARERALVKVGVSAASQFDYALRYHIAQARRAGCSPADIEHAILLTATTAGFPRMMAAFMIMSRELAKTRKQGHR